MQLTKSSSISLALAAASAQLLSNGAQAEETNQWQFDTAVLYYGEQDRVTAVEGVINAKKDFGDNHIFNGKLVIDGLTGASANGAVPQSTPQTFTRPSGKGAYTVAAGEVPLDDTFHDTRVQASAQWTQPLSDTLTGSIGTNISAEYDYFSLSVNGSLAKDFNRKNTTLSAGLSLAYDTIKPEGGLPVPFSSQYVFGGFNDDEFEDQDDNGIDDDRDEYDATRAQSSDSKTTVDLLFGITQVINRRLLVQANYGYSQVDGYLTDPFKMVSVVDNQGLLQQNLYENRPDSRTKHSIFVQGKYAFDHAVADVSYRFATDDWKIDSHTIDTRLRVNLGDGHYIQPHLRFYQQSAAEFYRPFLNDGEALPAYVSADYRIGEMDTYTVGLKYGMPLNGGDELAFRLEYYQQSPKNAGFDAPGDLANLDLYPAVKALIFQVSYHF